MVTLLFRNRSSSAREPVSDAPSQREPAEPEEDTALGVKRDRWWYESSYDLRNGLDVDDDAASTLPGELIDQLFKR